MINYAGDEQIDDISKKVSQGIGMLRRAKQFVKRETLQFFIILWFNLLF